MLSEHACIAQAYHTCRTPQSRTAYASCSRRTLARLQGAAIKGGFTTEVPPYGERSPGLIGRPKELYLRNERCEGGCRNLHLLHRYS